jgi:hypothetical protein
MLSAALSLTLASSNKIKGGATTSIVEELLKDEVFEDAYAFCANPVQLDTSVQPEQPFAALLYALGFLFEKGIITDKYDSYFLQPHIAAANRTSDQIQSANTLSQAMQRLFKIITTTTSEGSKIFLGIENGVIFDVKKFEELPIEFQNSDVLLRRYTVKINPAPGMEAVYVTCKDICFANTIPQTGVMMSSTMYSASSFATYFPMFAAVSAANMGFTTTTVGSRVEKMLQDQIDNILDPNSPTLNIHAKEYDGLECMEMAQELINLEIIKINGKNPHLCMHSEIDGELIFGVDRTDQIKQPVRQVLLTYLGNHEPHLLKPEVYAEFKAGVLATLK